MKSTRAELKTTGLLLRRFIWISAFAFWMGGFSFYGGVVVTIGAKVLAGGEHEFGFITRQVTVWLNIAGAIALVVFLLDWAMDREVLPPFGRWTLFAVWLAMAVMHGGLVAVHRRMDGLLDPDSQSIRQLTRFHQLHSSYLMISGLQWAASLILLIGTLYTWMRADRRESNRDFPRS